MAETPQAPASPASPPRRSRLRRAMLGALVSLLSIALVAVIAVAALWWALGSESGSARLIGWVPDLSVTNPKGSLIGNFAAERIEFVLPGALGTLRLERPRWQALGVSRGSGGRWLHLVIAELHADRATLLAPASPAATTDPFRPPSTLRLPIEIEIGLLTIGELRVGNEAGAQPTRLLRARVHLGADGGARHLLSDASAVRDIARFAVPRLRIDADPPFLIAARASAAAASATPAWRAEAAVEGPLDALAVVVTARATPSPTHPAQAFDARVVLQPFSAWPVGDLTATTQALDLSAFASGMPATSISGSATARTSGAAEPASVRVDLANARAGRWNEGLLPVRTLRAELSARPDQAERQVEIGSLAAELGTATQAAGRIAGSGRWTPERWKLDATVESLQPAWLDSRAAAMRLGGSVKVEGTGFAAATAAASPSLPGGSAPSPAGGRGQGEGGTAAATGRASGGPKRIELRAVLEGDVALADSKTLTPSLSREREREQTAARSVRVDVDAGWRGDGEATTIELRRFDASAGEATAGLTGTLSIASGSSPRLLRGELQLAGFDPTAWWPGAAARWRAAPHRIDATTRFDLALPPSPLGVTDMAGFVDAAAALRGSVAIDLAPSVVAGVAAQGEARLENRGGGAAVAADLVVGGNRLRADGTLGGEAAPAGRDRWQFTIDAPRLQTLAPLVAFFATPDAPRRDLAAISGALNASGRVAGRWPDVDTSGTLGAADLRFGEWSLKRAEATWRLASTPGAPLEAKLAASDLRHGTASLERIVFDLSGTASAHRLSLRAESKALPPQWVDVMQSAAVVAPASPPPATAARSVVSVEAAGGFVDLSGVRASGWRGTLQRIEIARLAAPAAPWLAARDVRAAASWRDGLRIELAPGSATVLGAALRWQVASWQSGPAPAATPRVELRAEVDAVPLAPILARLQPGFGWGGDLAVAARVDIRSAPLPTADVTIARTAGDLTVTDEFGSSQSLGITDARLTLTARDGVWTLAPTVAGSALGSARGTVVARTGSATAWPGAQTPIDGRVEVRVANLGVWGTWVPAGWRLGGELRADASISGRIGAPEYTGRIDGSQLSARNFVEGVDVGGGEVAIALTGDSARIERFTARAGNGTARLEGNATLGAAPVARLRLVLEQFRLLGRVDRRIVASGAASLRLDAQALALDGRFAVDEGLIDFSRADAPELGGDVEVVRRRGSDPLAEAQAPDPTPPPLSRKVALDLRVDLGEKLRVRGRGLDAMLRGELHLTSPNGRLAVAGTVRAVDGSYAAYGQRLAIDRGVLVFSGAVANPRLDIEATRPNLDVRVGVAVTGTAQNPRVRLFSEPSMTDLDKLSWLVLGRASESAGRADTALLQRAALALLAGEGPGVTDRITQALGLDEISVRQSEGELRETFVGLGKQISKRWYVGYEQGLRGTTGSWQLIYRIARRLTVRAQAGGDNAIDLIWTLRWK